MGPDFLTGSWVDRHLWSSVPIYLCSIWEGNGCFADYRHVRDRSGGRATSLRDQFLFYFLQSRRTAPTCGGNLMMQRSSTVSQSDCGMFSIPICYSKLTWNQCSFISTTYLTLTHNKAICHISDFQLELRMTSISLKILLLFSTGGNKPSKEDVLLSTESINLIQKLDETPVINAPLASCSFFRSASLCSLVRLLFTPRAPITSLRASIALVWGLSLAGRRLSEDQKKKEYQWQTDMMLVSRYERYGGRTDKEPERQKYLYLCSCELWPSCRRRIWKEVATSWEDAWILKPPELKMENKLYFFYRL